MGASCKRALRTNKTENRCGVIANGGVNLGVIAHQGGDVKRPPIRNFLNSLYLGGAKLARAAAILVNKSMRATTRPDLTDSMSDSRVRDFVRLRPE